MSVRTGQLSLFVPQPSTTHAQSLELASKIIASANLSHVSALCELDSVLFISAFESGSAGAYLVEIKDVKSPVVLKILTEIGVLLHTDEEVFSSGLGYPRYIVKSISS